MFSKCLAPLAALVLLLGACQRPEPVHPALWQVDGPNGQRAWLFGTIHALEEPVDWHSPRIDKALGAADRVVLEVAAIDDDAGIARSFDVLGKAPQPRPLADRIPLQTRPAYQAYLKAYHLDDTPLAAQDTWSAALILAQAAQQATGSKREYGVDRAVKQAAGTRPVEEFEGADAQLRIFDSLPEKEQADLLMLVIKGNPGNADREVQKIETAWKSGDVAGLAGDTQGGLLIDPELRAALLVNRNRAWTSRLIAMLTRGQRPFVAVGTAHLVGPDSLPALLTAQGYRVTRLQ